ncbi:MAG: tRNA (N6-isopentenyl adenosine(37)-C2)-methylthiotransferase MiaB [Spirochaetes bacterium]|nr:tRNA (N6-isopentenyl adenosine(37)-C2)-methylthiotransferase MiaB [Spirochaetota bacterium]
MNKNFYIETFGCQMNVGDSELIRLSMNRNNFNEVSNPKDAYICIFNTCSIREHAEKRALGRIAAVKGKDKRGDKLIVVAGCMAQRLGKELIKKSGADIVVGPYQSPNIGDIVSNMVGLENDRLYISQDKSNLADRIPYEFINIRGDDPWHKWVTITHGCENFCAYCIVPLTRGKLISFNSDRIVEYIKGLTESGVIEITLLGQNVNQYGKDSDDIPFYKLLEKISSVEQLVKINFLTSHPMDFTEDIIRVINNSINISRSIHLPIQSGSDNILKAMNRKYTSSHYYSIIEKIDKIISDYAVSTDFIVGFPGETDDDFNMTLEVVKNIKFDEAFMFAFSPRDGTPAYLLNDSVDENVKQLRLEELISIQRKFSLEKLKKRVNKQEKVIADKISKRSNLEVSGKTFLSHPIVFTGDHNDIGRERIVEIDEVRGSTLFGKKIG